MKKANNFDDKINLIVEKITQLEKDIKFKTSDSEKEAKQASKKTSEYRNRTEESKNKALDYLSKIENTHRLINNLYESSVKINAKSDELKNEIIEVEKHSSSSLSSLLDSKKTVVGYVSQLESIFDEHPDLDSELERLNEIIVQGEDSSSKINLLYKSSLTKKQQIDELFYDINGYTDEDENGEEYEVDGLKSKLEKTYITLRENVDNLENDLSKIKEENLSELEEVVSSTEKSYTTQIESWEKKYKKLEKEIENLLPNALTAGLSSAYSAKKSDEVKESKKLIRRFNLGIFSLILVSLIPFFISFESFKNGIDFEEVILRLPRVVASTLPLYIPVLWLAYSSNKKMNLSKRLIEEYTHKEVLSKTFEGLSKQINDIEDTGVSTELRIKLLYNILEVSSENPGKLISDYNKSDHPLMDALEKSNKLSNAIDRINKVPGLGKLSKILDNKSKKIISETAEKVDEILDEID